MLSAPLRLLANVWSLLWHIVSLLFFKLGVRLRRTKRVYLEFNLKGTLNLEQPKPGRLYRWFGRGDEAIHSLLGWRRWTTTLIKAQEVQGIVLNLDDFSLSNAHLGDLIHLLLQVKEAKKQVVVHVHGGTLLTLRLLACADKALMTPAGRLYTFGLRFDQLFALPLLQKLGITAQFVHIGAFKTATHTYHKSAPTPPQDAMMRALFEGMTEFLTQQICSQRPALLPSHIAQMISSAPIDGDHALHLGALDDLVFRRDLEAWLGNPTPRPAPYRAHPALLGPQPEGLEKKSEKSRKNDKTSPLHPAILLHGASYLDGHPSTWRWKPLFRSTRYIAVLDLQGAILMGAQDGGLPVGRSPVIQAEEVIPVLTSIAEDPRCLGVLLHINSPGGSALASDLMWHHLVKLRQKKPLVAYCSDVAASGGYYLACAAHRIVARRETITGSIGVLVGKVSGGEALEKAGVSVHSIYQDDNALFTSPYHALSPQGMENLREDARGFYRRFLERVGMARGIERARLHRWARGRVYLGSDALARGLVDDLGGLQVAIDMLYDLCETTEERAPLRHLAHHKHSLRDVLSKSLNLQSTLPEGWVDAAQLLRWLKEEQVLALMPWRPKW